MNARYRHRANVRYTKDGLTVTIRSVERGTFRVAKTVSGVYPLHISPRNAVRLLSESHGLGDVHWSLIPKED